MGISHSPLKIAVIIAMRERSAKMQERFFKVMEAQTRRPELIIIVDDFDPSAKRVRAELSCVASSCVCDVVCLENDRTPGLSGAWNVALDALVEAFDESTRVFVAILAEGDTWTSDHLAQSLLAAEDHTLDVVVYEREPSESKTICASEALHVQDILSDDSGGWDSNLFVRLSVLLAAGGFDEGLQRMASRDLHVRIAELGFARYGRLPCALPEHHNRLERAGFGPHGGEASSEESIAFWRKHIGHMSSPPLELSDGANSRSPWNAPAPALHQGDSCAFGAPPPHEPFQLYVGVITAEPTMLRPLLDGLVLLASSHSLRGLSVLVLDNGSPPHELGELIQNARRTGLDVAVIDEARQRLDAAAGGFGARLRERPRGQVGIAMARTMLQRYLGAMMAADVGSFGWVLDDDMRVDARARAYLPWLPAFRQRGADALIGASEGSSPNPPLNGLRVQLVDLFYNLRWLRGLSGGSTLPDRTAENVALRARFPDYYYDLSRKHTGHLETPHWLEPAAQGETVEEAYARLLNGAVGLLNGAPLTRPVIVTPQPDPLASAKDSVNRGGCTFILNPRALTETPNTIMSIHGREARRSDMVWAIVNRYYRRMDIKAVAFPIHHVGRVNMTPSLNIEKVQGELVGSTLYAGLTELLRRQPEHTLDFTREEVEEVCVMARRHLARRLRALEQSFHRIAGLREALKQTVSAGELHELISHLDAWFTPEGFEQIRAGVVSHEPDATERFLGSLRMVADDYASASVSVDFIQEQLTSLDAGSR